MWSRTGRGNRISSSRLQRATCPCFAASGPHDQHDFKHAETLLHVFHPLVELPDRHLLASAIGLTLALLTGRTDLCSAGVFGAGKTRAAAAVIVGLIAIDPTLSVMICTKENAAAQAVAEHIVSMKLPDDLLCKFGRLIGFQVPLLGRLSTWDPKTAITYCEVSK